jgi:hypothetical protein
VVDSMSDPNLKKAQREIAYVPADHVFRMSRPAREGPSFININVTQG